MTADVRRWFWLRLLHMAPRDIVDLQGRMQSIEEGLAHLKWCTGEALTVCAKRDGVLDRPEIVLDDEWSK